MGKEVNILESLQNVNSENKDCCKNNGTKGLLLFGDSCEEICNAKAFVAVATGGVSTIDIKHVLFHQDKPGLDVELQHTHIVFFE